MSGTAALQNRVDRLRDKLGARPRPGEECDRPVVCAIIDDGDPVPAGAPTCPRCGDVHTLRIEELVVDPPDGGGGGTA